MVLNEAQIIKDHTDLVRAIARNYSSTFLSHDDLVQEGFIALLLAARSWNPGGAATLRTYAARSIVNALGKACRRASESSAVEDDIGLTEMVASSDPSPETLFMRAQESELLRLSIAQLPAQEKDVINVRLAACGRGPLQKKMGAAIGETQQNAGIIETRAVKRLSRMMGAHRVAS